MPVISYAREQGTCTLREMDITSYTVILQNDPELLPLKKSGGHDQDEHRESP